MVKKMLGNLTITLECAVDKEYTIEHPDSQPEIRRDREYLKGSKSISALTLNSLPRDLDVEVVKALAEVIYKELIEVMVDRIRTEEHIGACYKTKLQD